MIVIEQPAAELLVALTERFAGETFGVRAGAPLAAGDEAVEGALALRGVDAYQDAYRRYAFCAVCDFENGFLTVLSEHLWASEVIRRARPALAGIAGGCHASGIALGLALTLIIPAASLNWAAQRGKN